jgi:histidine triad (HIT) family protein
MQEPSIFTRIISGELPSHKIYEDNKTLAFLDIHAPLPGYTLVVPKVQVANLQDLLDDDYAAVMSTVKKVMKRQAEVFGPTYKICLKLMGFDVAHAHVHVFACKNMAEFRSEPNMSLEPDHAALAQMAKKLAF